MSGMPLPDPFNPWGLRAIRPGRALWPTLAPPCCTCRCHRKGLHLYHVVHVGLQGAAKIHSRGLDPDCWQTQWLALGDMNDETFREEGCERRPGIWPSKLNIGVAYHGESETSPGGELVRHRQYSLSDGQNEANRRIGASQGAGDRKSILHGGGLASLWICPQHAGL